MKKDLFKINVLETEEKKEKRFKESSSNQMQNLLIGISLILLLLLIVYLFFAMYLPQKQSIEEAEIKENRLSNEFNSLNSKTKEIQTQKDFYLQLRSEAVSWVEKMLYICDELPENIWLLKFEFNGRSGKIKGGQLLKLSGSTFSGFRKENLDQIGVFLTKINQSDEFKKEFNNLHLNFTKRSVDEWGITLFEYTTTSRDLMTEASAR